MVSSKRKAALALLILIPFYIGPYVYVYGMTEFNVFPRVVKGDDDAIEKLSIRVDTMVKTLRFAAPTRTVGTQTVRWNETLYTLKFGVFNRIFTTYIKFPALLDVLRLSFKATGVFNGTIIMTCSHYADRLIVPTGFEVILIFGSILKAGNNTFLTSFCTGPGYPVFDFAKLSQSYLGVLPIALNWELSATIRGEKVEQVRDFAGIQNATIVLP